MPDTSPPAAAELDTILLREPVAFYDLGLSPKPNDLLGAALFACTTITLRLYARRKAWPLEAVSVRVSHARGSFNARDAFTRKITVTGALDAAQRARLAEIANRCPVHQTLEHGAVSSPSSSRRPH